MVCRPARRLARRAVAVRAGGDSARLAAARLFFGLQLGRVWVIASLGRRWTTRLIVLPDANLVKRRPLSLAPPSELPDRRREMAILPLAFAAVAIAVVFSACNVLLLARRIHLENTPRSALPSYHIRETLPRRNSLWALAKNRIIPLLSPFDGIWGEMVDLERSFGFLVHDVARLSAGASTATVDGSDLTRAQCRTLGYLARNEGINQAGLADLLEIRPMTLVRQIDRMQEAGWIERRPDPTDRRARRLFLTDKARPILGRIWDVATETQDQVLRRAVARRGRTADRSAAPCARCPRRPLACRDAARRRWRRGDGSRGRRPGGRRHAMTTSTEGRSA
jgi:DNA-binding MarR family transcriptional regulator